MKGSSFESKTGVFSIFAHFTAVVVLSTTWNDLMFSAVWTRQTCNFLFQFSNRSHQFHSRMVNTAFLLNDLEEANDMSIEETWSYLFGWHSHNCRNQITLHHFEQEKRTIKSNCNCSTDSTQESLYITNLKNIRQKSGTCFSVHNSNEDDNAANYEFDWSNCKI